MRAGVQRHHTKLCLPILNLGRSVSRLIIDQMPKLVLVGKFNLTKMLHPVIPSLKFDPNGSSSGKNQLFTVKKIPNRHATMLQRAQVIDVIDIIV